MPHVSVYVDLEDVLDEVSDQDLRDELVRREKRKGKIGSPFSADHMIPQQVARCTLDEASDILRKQGRTDLAYKLDEVRVDYVEH
jgi:hypothetical protein